MVAQLETPRACGPAACPIEPVLRQLAANTKKDTFWSTDKIVQMTVGLILTGVLVWAGSTIQQLSSEVVELRATVKFHSDMMKTYVTTAAGQGRKLAEIETRLAALGGPNDPLFPKVQNNHDDIVALTARLMAIEKQRSADHAKFGN
jgi:hypothetical protein